MTRAAFSLIGARTALMPFLLHFGRDGLALANLLGLLGGALLAIEVARWLWDLARPI